MVCRYVLLPDPRGGAGRVKTKAADGAPEGTKGLKRGWIPVKLAGNQRIPEAVETDSVKHDTSTLRHLVPRLACRKPETKFRVSVRAVMRPDLFRGAWFFAGRELACWDSRENRMASIGEEYGDELHT